MNVTSFIASIRDCCPQRTDGTVAPRPAFVLDSGDLGLLRSLDTLPARSIGGARTAGEDDHGRRPDAPVHGDTARAH